MGIPCDNLNIELVYALSGSIAIKVLDECLRTLFLYLKEFLDRGKI